jgi:hypothetical protein
MRCVLTTHDVCVFFQICHASLMLSALSDQDPDQRDQSDEHSCGNSYDGTDCCAIQLLCHRRRGCRITARANVCHRASVVLLIFLKSRRYVLR